MYTPRGVKMGKRIAPVTPLSHPFAKRRYNYQNGRKRDQSFQGSKNLTHQLKK